MRQCPPISNLSTHQARLILSQLPHIGPVLADRLQAAFGDLATAFRASRTELLSVAGIGPIIADTLSNHTRFVDLSVAESKLAAIAATFITPENTLFPKLLNEMPDTPIGLYVKGTLKPAARCISIVGSRRATLYGLKIAKKLANDLTNMGFSIISGMARGIDAAAHEGALEANGDTVAVLGCGVDIIYPPEHALLYEKIAQQGAIVSEFAPGRSADRQTFPLRNRIIAGMSAATIVVESDLHGGSMITARLAGEYGRLLFAVPGRIDQPSSRGCHALIRDGATLFTHVEDVLEALAPLGQIALPLEEKAIAASPKASTFLEELIGEEALLFQTLSENGASTIDRLSGLSQLPVYQIAGHLLSLELKRRIVKRADGFFEAKI